MDVIQIPLIGGHPVLDFLNSGENFGQQDEVNYLGSYKALVEWSVRVELVDAETGAILIRHAARKPSAAQQAWRQAMELRRNLLAIVHAQSLARTIPVGNLEKVNAAIGQALRQRVLKSHGSEVGLAWRDTTDLNIVTMKLATGAAELLANPIDRQRVKTCANGTCGWVFLDTSGRRRWCRMNVCGTADKVRRFRAKQKSEK